MKIMKIDLYEVNNLSRESGREGYLTVMGDKPNNKDVAVLIIAGGGYDHVSVREQFPVSNFFESVGYKTFVLHYTPKLPYPVAFCEAAMAMKYIRDNFAAFGIDPDKIVGIGFSAGAHLLGTLALKHDVSELNGIGSFDNADAEQTVIPSAIIMCYPVILSEGKYAHKGSFKWLLNGVNRPIDEFSLEKYVKKNSPPCFIWHTFTDASVPVFNSLKLAEAYAEKGAECTLRVYAKGRHGLSVATDEVCSKQDLAEMSADVPEWKKSCLDWLSEIGF